MSKAEELLNSLVEAYVAESNPSSDSHIVIGVDRFITVPDELKRIAVQYDHNMRTVTFDCPRYYDGRDMSKMTVYINIRGPKGAPHSYIADNVRVDASNPNVMHFDWTLRRPVTDVKGNLVFLVYIRKADAEGNEENHWNSELNTELYISEGMEYEAFEEYPYSDIVTQLLQRMGDVETLANPEAMQGYANTWLDANSDTVLEDIQSKGNEVLNSIPEEYTETYNYAAEGARTKADAIIRTVEGKTIAASDSSDDYLRGLRLFGKTTQVQTTGAQLVDYTSGNCSSGVTKSFKNDILKVTGDGTLPYQSWSTNIREMVVKHPGKKLYFDCEKIETTNAPDGTIIQLNISKSDGSKEYIALYSKISERKPYDIPSDPSTISDIAFSVYTSNHATASPNTITITKPMLQIGTEKLIYEPYSGGVVSPSLNCPQELSSIENPVVTVCGKNLLKPRNFSSNGYKVTVYEDGSITVTGAAETTETIYLMITPYSDAYPLKLHRGVEYFMWSESSNGKSIGTKSIDLHGDPVWSNIETWNTNIPHKCDRIVQVYIESKNHAIGDTSLCGTYRFQLEVGNKFTGFEGYKEQQELSILDTFSGIPVSSGGNYIDANGQRWICDEVDFERGVYVKRLKTTVLSAQPEFFETEDQLGRFTWYCLDDEYKSGREVSLCNYAPWRAWGIGDGTGDYGGISMHQIYYSPAEPRTADEVNAKFEQMRLDGNPATIVGQLATPIEIALSAEELNAFRAIRTNYPNTTVLNDSNVKMELKYNADTQLYIDNKIAEAVAALANKA